MSRAWWIGSALALAACGGGAIPAPAGPAARGSAPDRQTPPPVTKPAAATHGLPVAPSAVPPPPATCTALVAHASGSSCGADARDALEHALAATDRVTADGELAALEGCSAFPRGLIRALRAERAPRECGDALVEPALAAAPGELDVDIRDALTGLGLASRLSRLAADPPRLQPPVDKAHFMTFLQERLAPWIAGQAKAIYDIAIGGSKLHGYGMGVVAVESGVADLRFVEVVREVPLPDELAKDKELKDVYYAALDQALDPRKDRGRDAALVGLRELWSLGVLSDARVNRARVLLSKLYGGRRIDLLDGLLMPALPAATPTTTTERLAAELPTFYAARLLGDANPADPGVLRALLERGLPPAMRSRLESSALPNQSRELFAHALVRLGELYWRSGDFAKAAEVAGSPAAADKQVEDAKLIAALATALSGGPKDAAEMMLRGPFLPGGVGNVADLDRIAGSKSPNAGLAAWDAAYILAMVPPTDADVGFWKDLGKRYRKAAKLLVDKKQRKLALDRAKAADDTAKAIAKNAKKK